MFLIDKYTVSDPWDVQFNKEIFRSILKLDSLNSWNTLKNMENDFNNLPNLLVYGQPGNGKKSLVNLLLKRIYGNCKMTVVPYSITGYGSNIRKVDIEQSLYHIEINPTGTGLDKYLVQEVVKKYASTQALNFNKTRSFQIVWIHDIHNLSHYAQAALRCTMEKYSRVCKFILTGTQLTNILSPIKSRCLKIRLPSPTKLDILKVLMDISYKEDNYLTAKEYNDIIEVSNFNIKDAIWALDFKYHGVEMEKPWKIFLNGIINILKSIITKKFEKRHVDEIRVILYKVFKTNIDGHEIIKELLDLILIEFKSYKLDYEIINICTQFNFALAKGKRSIIHIEAFIYRILDLLYRKKKKLK